MKVFHFLISHWGNAKDGTIECGSIHCEWIYSDHIRILRENFLFNTDRVVHDQSLISVSLYNVHSWWERTRSTSPAICELHTNLTMFETEESHSRFGQLFDQSFKHFDGYSSISPKSAVQRIYFDAYLYESDLLPLHNFSSLVKGASYVASDCHKHDPGANSNRDGIIHTIRQNGYRVDGLGRCMHTEPGPEGLSLPRSRDTRYNLHIKRQVIGRYLFNMAFENTYEDGYVTEKPFDALRAGGRSTIAYMYNYLMLSPVYHLTNHAYDKLCFYCIYRNSPRLCRGCKTA